MTPYHRLPNQLTLLRLVLAGLFFVLLDPYHAGTTASQASHWLLPFAAGVFVLAVFTDYLDGYLARRWEVVSAFGRIMDPFCDKVLILGGFAYLAGPGFVDPVAWKRDATFHMVSGVYPWMVVVILARELLVTGIRGELEGRGVQFGANLFGKSKMVLQSLAVPLLLLLVWVKPGGSLGWIGWTRHGVVYLTVAVTLASGLPYLFDAVRVLSPIRPPSTKGVRPTPSRE